MRKLILLCLLVSACEKSPPVPCMKANEVGVVAAATTEVREFATRGGPAYFYDTTVTLEVGGVHRVCHIDDTSLTQLQPGMKVNLSSARRKY